MSAATLTVTLTDADGSELLSEALPSNVADYARNTVAGAVQRIRENAGYLASQTPSVPAGASGPSVDPSVPGKPHSSDGCKPEAVCDESPWPAWFDAELLAKHRRKSWTGRNVDIVCVQVCVYEGDIDDSLQPLYEKVLAGRTGTTEVVAQAIREAVEDLEEGLAGDPLTMDVVNGPRLPIVPPADEEPSPRVATPDAERAAG